jgi:uncharacterized protein
MEFSLVFTLLFLFGALSSFVGTIVGGAGLINIPFLMFLGLPPHIAIATHKFGAVGLRIGSIPKFWKEKVIVWKYVVPFMVISFIGAFIGANILIAINKELLSRLIGFVLLIPLPLIFMKKDIGTIRKYYSKGREYIGYFLLLLTAIYSAVFSAGYGILNTYIYIAFFGLPMVNLAGTGKVAGVVGSVTAVIIFILNDMVNYQYGLVILAGMILGGYLGAHVAIKKGNLWLKRVLFLLVIASAIKLIFF